MNCTNKNYNKKNKSFKYNREGHQEPIFKNILEYYFKNGTVPVKYVISVLFLKITMYLNKYQKFIKIKIYNQLISKNFLFFDLSS